MDKKRLDYYTLVKGSGVISEKLFKCFEYILKYGPITSNELIDKISSLEDVGDAYNTMSWNKLPSQLKDCNIVKIVGRRKCKSPLTKSESKVKVWDVTFEKPIRGFLLSKKIKDLVSQAQHSALLAVEIYNKPSVKFKSEAYITLMMIAWTKALHAYFIKNDMDYFYREKDGKISKNEDGENKTWDLSKCIREYKNFKEPVQKNLEVHIKIRNRIVHGTIDFKVFDTVFFPECQSVLLNLENFLIENFGSEYAINNCLAFSLQFSAYRTGEQIEAIHKLSNVKAGKLFEFLNLFRGQLSNEVYNSPEYGIRLISIPQIQSSGRSGVPVEFINWDHLTDYQKEDLSKVHAIIKTKREILEVSNAGKKRASEIQKLVSELTNSNFNQHNFKCFCFVYSIRPYDFEKKKKFDISEKYCAYDEVHDDYVYESSLADLISRAIISKKINVESLNEKFRKREKSQLRELISSLMAKM